MFFSSQGQIMFRQISVSAPSKVILHGEHAVVYGKSAIAASLDLRTRMYLTPIPDEKQQVLEVDFPDVHVHQSWKVSEVQKYLLQHKPGWVSKYNAEICDTYLKLVKDFIQKSSITHGKVVHQDLQLASLTCFFYLFSVICDADHIVPLKIRVESDIPIGAGLGSSAALSVCLAAGLHAIQSGKTLLDPPDQDNICQLALLSEKILHGKPSGIDNAISTYGGFIRFQQGCVEPIEFNPAVNLQILLVNSCVSRQTKDMVAKVKDQYDKYPSAISPLLESIHGISESFLQTLKEMGNEEEGEMAEDKYTTLNDLIRYNQSILKALQVSHPTLENILNVAEEHGLVGKLTGAGGGGFAFILLPPGVTEKTVEEVKEKLHTKSFVCYEAELGVNGVHIQIDNSDCISQ